MAAPRSTQGSRRATFHSACALASSSIPLEMSGPAAALLVHQLDAVARRLQQLHRGAPDLGRVVGDEGVVEEHHVAARRLGRRAAPIEPVGEGLAREGGQRPPPVDARDPLHEPAVRPGARDPVGDRRQPRAEPREPRDVPEQPVAQGQPVDRVVVVQELVLHLGHVHVGRALRLAALALEAEVHHLVEPLAREVGRRHLAGQHRPQRVGAPARGVLLVPRGHVGRAHGALELLAADPDAVAHLDRGREAALRREVEQRLRLPRLVLGAVAEVLGDAGAAHDVARVHQPARIEGGLRLPERPEHASARTRAPGTGCGPARRRARSRWRRRRRARGRRSPRP